ncbi:heat shock factor binding protein 1-domain-containing protein [Phaeosphaeria sp. MPI-PUGE-AT-0046c]|nr:heat shock factor binding protein 1-domain-containing protein [Phaeosphaeria sp. MPI-PUGE-AT-0046c]
MSHPRPSVDRAASDATPVNASSDSSVELAAVVDDLLSQLNTKFSTISSELLAKMDDMSRRLDNLEATIQTGEGSKGPASDK